MAKLGCGYNYVRPSTSGNSTISEEMSATQYLATTVWIFVYLFICFTSCVHVVIFCCFFYLSVFPPRSSLLPLPLFSPVCELAYHLSANPEYGTVFFVTVSKLTIIATATNQASDSHCNCPCIAGVWFVKLPVLRIGHHSRATTTRPGLHPNQKERSDCLPDFLPYAMLHPLGNVDEIKYNRHLPHFRFPVWLFHQGRKCAYYYLAIKIWLIYILEPNSILISLPPPLYLRHVDKNSLRDVDEKPVSDYHFLYLQKPQEPGLDFL